MIGFPKGRTRKSLKAQKDRAEARVIQVVRQACVDRDGYSRMVSRGIYFAGLVNGGPSEWAHLTPRARTRNMRPEVRHHTAITVMLTQKEHDALDGRSHPRLYIEPLTGRGADGPLRYRFNGTVREDAG